MNGPNLMIVLSAGLALLLTYAAIGDVRSRTIPNWLVMVVAALAPAMWWTIGMPVWPDMAYQIALAAGFLALFAVFFALNVMGGGDVKLIAALALWFPLAPFLRVLMIMSILGGVITIAMWLYEKSRKSGKNIEVPYGVAISLAALWGVHERYLNHFG